MKDLASSLLNRWIEYDGGSRAGSSRLMFTDTNTEMIILHIVYVFDWNTEERVHLTFTIPRAHLLDCIARLEHEHHSTVFVDTESEKLRLDWRIHDDRVQFQVVGRNTALIGGAITYDLKPYRDLFV